MGGVAAGGRADSSASTASTLDLVARLADATVPPADAAWVATKAGPIAGVRAAQWRRRVRRLCLERMLDLGQAIPAAEDEGALGVKNDAVLMALRLSLTNEDGRRNASLLPLSQGKGAKVGEHDGSSADQLDRAVGSVRASGHHRAEGIVRLLLSLARRHDAGAGPPDGAATAKRVDGDDLGDWLARFGPRPRNDAAMLPSTSIVDGGEIASGAESDDSPFASLTRPTHFFGGTSERMGEASRVGLRVDQNGLAVHRTAHAAEAAAPTAAPSAASHDGGPFLFFRDSLGMLQEGPAALPLPLPPATGEDARERALAAAPAAPAAPSAPRPPPALPLAAMTSGRLASECRLDAPPESIEALLGRCLHGVDGRPITDFEAVRALMHILHGSLHVLSPLLSCRLCWADRISTQGALGEFVLAGVCSCNLKALASHLSFHASDVCAQAFAGAMADVLRALDDAIDALWVLPPHTHAPTPTPTQSQGGGEGKGKGKGKEVGKGEGKGEGKGGGEREGEGLGGYGALAQRLHMMEGGGVLCLLGRSEGVRRQLACLAELCGCCPSLEAIRADPSALHAHWSRPSPLQKKGKGEGGGEKRGEGKGKGRGEGEGEGKGRKERRRTRRSPGAGARSSHACTCVRLVALGKRGGLSSCSSFALCRPTSLPCSRRCSGRP